jgi:hypothetical protein
MEDWAWSIELLGEPEDLDEALRLSGSDDPSITRIDRHGRSAVVLKASKFESMTDPWQVQEAANVILSRLNGILYLSNRRRKPLRFVGGPEYNPPEGRGTVYLLPETAVFVIESGGAGRAELSSSVAEQWLGAAGADDIVDEVLSLLRGEPDWTALYGAFELMKENRSRRGSKHALDWPNEEAQRFSDTANLFRHSKLSRTGQKKSGRTHFEPMKPAEATDFIRELAIKWLAWRCNPEGGRPAA